MVFVDVKDLPKHLPPELIPETLGGPCPVEPLVPEADPPKAAGALRTDV